MLFMIPQDFGFGPSAAVSLVAEAIRKYYPSAPLALAGSQFALQVHNLSIYDMVYELPEDMGGRAAMISAFSDQMEGAFLACEFPIGHRLIELGIPTVLYDMLLWFWPYYPYNIPRYCLYITQRFFGTTERCRRLRRDGYRVLEVGPLVTEERWISNVDDEVILNLNGFFNPLVTQETAMALARFYRAVLRSLRFKEMSMTLLVTGDEHLIDAVLDDKTLEDLTSCCLSPLELSRRAARAKACLTTPGLGSIYQYCAMGIPTYLLPPTNSSQRRQLLAMRKHVGWEHASNWNELLCTEDAATFSSESKEIRAISDQIQRAASSDHAINGLVDRIKSFLHTSSQIPTRDMISGEQLIHNMGGPGCIECASGTMRFLASEGVSWATRLIMPY